VDFTCEIDLDDPVRLESVRISFPHKDRPERRLSVRAYDEAMGDDEYAPRIKRLSDQREGI
jgi:hypothetical protein